MKHYVIIGNGVAAAGCIEGIRSRDKESKITVVSEERHIVYCRPLISYYLEGKSKLENMSYRGNDFYERMNCHVLFQRKAIGIDAEKKSVSLDDGEKLSYDELLVATGSSPFVPPFKGLDTVEKKYSFMTLDDALALEKGIDEKSNVLIIGAGLIGLKCAEGLLERVKSITVCDLADRVLSSILDNDCAALMQRTLEKKGISFLLGDSVTEFRKNRADMQSGKCVPFDVLVLAVGVRANTALVKNIGGEIGRGIVVDDRMQTSIANIYAAGDCAEGMDISLGKRRVLAILPNAYMQGFTAGVNMAGGEMDHSKAIPMNSIGFFGMHAMTAGTYEGDMYEERGENSLKRLFTKDGLLKGYILVGCDERAGIYTSLIRERTSLDSINFDILKKAATTVAFSREERKRKFGGAV